MEKIKQYLGKGGLFIAALGVMSCVLSIFNYNVRLLAWVDLWGAGIGWIIRIVLILAGGALFFFLGMSDDDDGDCETA